MSKVFVSLLILPFVFFLFSPSIRALDLSLEKDMERAFRESRAVLVSIDTGLERGAGLNEEIARLRVLAEEIRACHLLMEERFRLREEELGGLGKETMERHRTAVERYREAVETYLGLTEKLFSLLDEMAFGGHELRSVVSRLGAHLDRVLSKARRPLWGSLPYRHLNDAPGEPKEGPSIKPAYLGGEERVLPEDLKGTLEAPLSLEVREQAQKLLWNPVLIYEWVKNEVETEWYWGCMKGAEETLRQRRGNDCDQAALMVALFRASGYPARYVRGVIEFYPDLGRAKNLTGIEEGERIGEYLRKAGIPFRWITGGGGIRNVELEHLWVEVEVPYGNYRGAVLGEEGKRWLGLDTSIKVKGYAYNRPMEGGEGFSFGELRDEYWERVREERPLEYLRERLEGYLMEKAPGAGYEDLLRKRVLIPEVLNILPSSLQYRVVKVTDEYKEIPEELLHRVRLRGFDGRGAELFDLSVATHRVSNQRVVLSYEAETMEDQEVVNGYGGLSNTPAYLVRLRPVVKVNGERIGVGKEGLSMGEAYEVEMELIAPNGTERVRNRHVAGNVSVIGIVSQRAVMPGEVGDEERDGERVLYEEAIRYIDRWNQAEEELASLLGLSISRPMPTVVTVGGAVEVSSLLGIPQGMEWKGVYVDSDLRAIEVVESGKERSWGGGSREFMGLSSLEGSILENRLFEEDLGVESISTAKLIGKAREEGIEVLEVDQGNVDALLPDLPFDEELKKEIREGVRQGLVVRLPRREISYEAWKGIGYVVEKPETGESGYMLGGGIGGGMTVWGMDKWPAYYRDRLRNPYGEVPNYDVGSARYIQKVTRTDMQRGRVGEVLSEPLQVVVYDIRKRPVVGAEVTFRVKAGGGKFRENGQASVTVKTDGMGIAQAWLILGEKTSANPSYWREKAEARGEQVGENLVEAFLVSGGAGVTRPFTAYGFPGVPTQMRRLHGEEGKGSVLSFSGFVSVVIEDRYGNPRSNLEVEFVAGEAEEIGESVCENPNRDMRQAYLVRVGDECLRRVPVWGECGDPWGQRVLREVTGIEGAAAEVILGGVPGARYPIRVRCKSPECLGEHGETREALSTTFYHYTYPFGNCGGMEDPGVELIVEQVYPTDFYGNNINGGPVGGKIPLRAKMYFLVEKEEEREVKVTCGGGEETLCRKVVGGRQYEVRTDFNGDVVTFGGEAARYLRDGLYEGIYTLKAGVNEVWVSMEGALGVRRTEVCPSCETGLREVRLRGGTKIRVYGLEVGIEGLPMVMVDERGHTGRDYEVRYRISPEEYEALSAWVVVRKEGEEVAWIPGERRGEGKVVIGKGFWFDVESRYEVEVVLNGGTGLEVRSGRKRLGVGRVGVIRDDVFDSSEVEEVEYSDGRKGRKRYRVELRSKGWAESCSELTGEIRMRGRDGEVMRRPGEGYYPTRYELGFTEGLGRCWARFKDVIDGGETVWKERFIVSNLSTEGLRRRGFDGTDTVVLYGGIGSSLEIEVSGTVKALGLEPLGVVLIGIDGLRQDVLYPQGEEDVGEPEEGLYRVEIGELTGMKQILEGYDMGEGEERHVMLRGVSAIFPSITYASWASILTGREPRDTGIVGNEFFGRDLSGGEKNPIPGMAESGIPSGMVSFGSGAFQPGKGLDLWVVKGFMRDADFVFRYVMPMEVSVWGGLGLNQKLSEKLKRSAPGRALRSGVKPLWEEVGERVRGRYSISMDRDERCDGSGYECRTVSMYFQYAEGVDWWGTPGLTFSNALDGVLTRFDVGKLMDRGPVNDGMEFIRRYFSRRHVEGRRKRFPALFGIYLSGLDHVAHKEGMGAYRAFFQETTDGALSEFIKALKEQDEFDNKIFILVSDHGMTAMPTDLKYTKTETVMDAYGNEYEIEVPTPAETSCELKLDFQIDPVDPNAGKNSRKAELSNNNLHIWELAEVLKMVGLLKGTEGLSFAVMAPEEVAGLYKAYPYGAKPNTKSANVIAALNGPMAHIYVKNRAKASWGEPRMVEDIGLLAELLRLTLSKDKSPSNLSGLFPSGMFDKAIPFSTGVGRLVNSIDMILIKRSTGYELFRGIKSDLSDLISEPISDYGVKALLRLQGLHDPDRSGDIVLVFKDFIRDSPENRYTSGVGCKAWHGSLNESDSYVPFVIGYPGGNKFEVWELLRDVTACPSYVCEGNWNVTDVIKGIIGKQYGE